MKYRFKRVFDLASGDPDGLFLNSGFGGRLNLETKLITHIKLNQMAKLFYEGGPLFMGILTLVFFALVIQTVKTFIQSNQKVRFDKNCSLIRGIGLFGLIFGILGQLIGLYEAFDAIQQIGDISPALVAGGLKISLITTLYGFVIFLIAQLIWLVFQYTKKETA